MKVTRSFLLIVGFILLVGLACTIDLTGPTATEAPAQPPVAPVATDVPVIPTNAPAAPTDVPAAPVEAPTAAPVLSPFFTEEFDSGDLSQWTQFYIKGSNNADESKGSVTANNGKLNFKLESVDLYSYLIYDAQTYDNVRVEISADNRGKNNNNISLICRYSEEGWYEFSIANNGLYWIYAYDATGAVSKGYNTMANGGSTKIKQGKDTNVYAISCDGDVLRLFINGDEAAKWTDRKFKLPEGKVGVSVSSINVTPIIVDITYFKIDQP